VLVGATSRCWRLKAGPIAARGSVPGSLSVFVGSIATDQVAGKALRSCASAVLEAHVMQKLRLASRAELVRYAIAHGLLEQSA
jgi:hypothetical protein